MENISDMCLRFYSTVLRLVADRFFIHLPEFILHEFSRFAEEIDDLDPTELKPRGHVFTRRAVADFVAFFTICACFGSFIILSAKCVKEEQTRYNPPPRPATPESEGESLELLENEDFTISHCELDDARRNPWGDATVADCDLGSFARRKVGPQNRSRARCSSRNRESNSSTFELRASHSQHSQSTQTSERILQQASKNRDWLIRRTRSGHVYGKYPM